MLGAFQFSPALRNRGGWHGTPGHALITAGLVAALSSVPLGVFFGRPRTALALAMVRVVFAVAATVFLVRGAIAITRRDFAAHGAWMTRANAIAVSGGTRALVVALWSIILGEVGAFGETWLVAVGFMLNSILAELLIRRRFSGRVREVPGRGARERGQHGAEACR